MAEIRSGLRRVLSNPWVYGLAQGLLGASSAQKKIINNFIRPFSGMALLDVGCGPAEILSGLPEDVRYLGFDADPLYIASAKKRFGNRGHFFQGYVSTANIEAIGVVDLVMAFGVLHHLEDDEVRDLSGLAYQVVREGGRFLTIDPCFEEGQHWLSRYLISKDRGQNVRPAQEYEALIKDNGAWDTHVQVRHDLLRVPYTHVIIECTK